MKDTIFERAANLYSTHQSITPMSPGRYINGKPQLCAAGCLAMEILMEIEGSAMALQFAHEVCQDSGEYGKQKIHDVIAEHGSRYELDIDISKITMIYNDSVPEDSRSVLVDNFLRRLPAILHNERAMPTVYSKST